MAAQATGVTRPAAAEKTDGTSFWDMLVVWVLLIVFILQLEFKPDPFPILLILFASTFWLIVIMIRLAVNLFARRWRRVLSIVAAPLSVGLLLWGSHATGFSPDNARLLLWKHSYMAQLASPRGEQSGIQIEIWPWRHWYGGLLVPPEYFAELIYDSSDQIVLPPNRRSAEWYKSADAAGFSKNVIIHPERAEKAMFEQDILINRLSGHFYVATAPLD